MVRPRGTRTGCVEDEFLDLADPEVILLREWAEPSSGCGQFAGLALTDTVDITVR